MTPDMLSTIGRRTLAAAIKPLPQSDAERAARLGVKLEIALATLRERDATIAEQDAEIRRLRRQVSDLGYAVSA